MREINKVKSTITTTTLEAEYYITNKNINEIIKLKLNKILICFQIISLFLLSLFLSNFLLYLNKNKL